MPYSSTEVNGRCGVCIAKTRLMKKNKIKIKIEIHWRNEYRCSQTRFKVLNLSNAAACKVENLHA